MTKEEVISYWVKFSEDNLGSMRRMYETQDYMWSLFVGHLAIEQLLKALYVINTERFDVPRIHDLVKLAEKCGLQLEGKTNEALSEITLFNVKTRYDDYKRGFYKKCTKNMRSKI